MNSRMQNMLQKKELSHAKLETKTAVHCRFIRRIRVSVHGTRIQDPLSNFGLSDGRLQSKADHHQLGIARLPFD